MALFESADDRDGTITMWMVFILLLVVVYLFKEQIEDEAGFITGTILGYFGAIVQRFFKKNGDKQIQMPPEPIKSKERFKP